MEVIETTKQEAEEVVEDVMEVIETTKQEEYNEGGVSSRLFLVSCTYTCTSSSNITNSSNVVPSGILKLLDLSPLS